MTPGQVPFLDALEAVSGPLRGNGVRFILVGGLAVFAHGSPRATRDLDLAADATQTSADSIGSILKTTGLPVEGPIRNDFGLFYRVRHPACVVEVFLGGEHELHQREYARAIPVRLGSHEYRVLSVEDLILRKLVNLRLRRAEKDTHDLKALVHSNWDRIDREYVRRHGAIQRVVPWFEELLAIVEEERRAATGDDVG